MQPTVDVPDRARHRTTCNYSLSPGTRRCGDAATVHLLVFSDRWGLVSLSSCGAHHEIARVAGQLRGEHRFERGCAHRDARWHDDVIVDASYCVAPAGATV